MRVFALAAAALAAAAFAGSAEARPWNDPQGRMTVEIPRGYDVDTGAVVSDAERTVALFFTPQNDCYVIAFPNPGTANNTPFEVRRHVSDPAKFTAEGWTAVANGIPTVFPDNSAQYVSGSLDTTNYWPIQRAVLRNAKGVVHGALQLRPGTDLVVFCQDVNGSAPATQFDAIIRGVTTARDAELQATATTQEAEYTARQAAAAAAQAQAQQNNNNNNNNQNEGRRNRRNND